MRLPSRARATLIGRTELKRRFRAVRNDPRRSVALAIAGLFGILPVLVVVGGAYALGAGLGGDAFELLPLARSATGGLLGLVAVMTALRTASDGGSIDHPEGILTAVPHRDVALGLLLVEGANVALPLGAVASLGAVAFAVGAGSPATAALAVVAAILPVVLGLLAGFALGIAIRLVVSRIRVIARYKTVIGAALFLAYIGAIFAGSPETVFDPVVTVLRASPAGWYADLALLSVVPAADPVRALAALGAAVLGAPLLIALTIDLTGRLWFGDSVRTDERAEADVDERPGPAAPTGTAEGAGRSAAARLSALPGVGRPVARIARKNWLRARRAPIKLAYVVYPVFFLYAPVQGALEAGVVSPSVLTSIALYLAWSTGAAFTLNPFGDEGAVLPTTRTAPVSGREFVAGYCLAGAIVGVPVTALAIVVAGIAGGTAPGSVVAVAALGVVLAVCSTGIAAGAGAAFPKFEESRITRSRSAVVPSLIAFAAYSFALLVAGVPGSVVQVGPAREAVAGWLSVAEPTVRAVGLGVTAALAVLAAIAGVAYASRGFERYEL